MPPKHCNRTFRNMASPSKTTSKRKSFSGRRYVLGIDVGTTSVKVCIVNVDTKEVSHKFGKDTLAIMARDVPTADLQVRPTIIVVLSL